MIKRNVFYLNYTILTIGIGFAERYRIVKDARRGSHLIPCKPRSSRIQYFLLCGNAVLNGEHRTVIHPDDHKLSGARYEINFIYNTRVFLN